MGKVIHLPDKISCKPRGDNRVVPGSVHSHLVSRDAELFDYNGLVKLGLRCSVVYDPLSSPCLRVVGLPPAFRV